MTSKWSLSLSLSGLCLSLGLGLEGLVVTVPGTEISVGRSRVVTLGRPAWKTSVRPAFDAWELVMETGRSHMTSLFTADHMYFPGLQPPLIIAFTEQTLLN